MSHDRVGPRAVLRSAAFLAAGVLAVPVLAGCSEEDPAGKALVGQDIAPAARDRIADGGTLRWAVDSVPETLNAYQADADATTMRVAGAVLPSMYRMDANGRPERNAPYLESAEIVEREPRQVVLYKLHQEAVWSNGREIGAADFAAQWRALSGKDSAYWTARNAGYDRIEKVERGAGNLEVRVTFRKPYADWRSLFSPLYPKEVTGTPDAFNDGARRKLALTAGPFALKRVSRADGEITLTRDSHWWGRPAKLEQLVLRSVPREDRAEALAGGKVDIAEISPQDARRITAAAREQGRKGALPSRGASASLDAAGAPRPRAVAHGSDAKGAGEKVLARAKRSGALAAQARRRAALSDFVVRKSLEPAYTQLALNGSDGPLADERVRRAVARALDRKELARLVLKPLGLPAIPVGSHLALAGQAAYADSSGALGDKDTEEAQALLADAGWVKGGPVKEPKKKAAGAEATQDAGTDDSGSDDGTYGPGGEDGTYIVGGDDKPYVYREIVKRDRARQKERERQERERERQRERELGQDGKAGEDGFRNLARDGVRFPYQDGRGGAPGAYAPRGTAAPARAASGPLAKDGKALTLRFVLPSGAGSESLRAVGKRIARMLERVGIRTKIVQVPDDSYFKDHVANGQYDLALYSWPASAYPATDARPIYSKPVPGADGSLSVEQNYTRVGTDRVDQLFDQAVSTLNEGESRSLIRKADARIWAAAGSIPLYQRPQLTAVKRNLVNAGSFGFRTPVYEDMGFLKKGARPAAGPTARH
ncbi:ABC transporter family substrate-binding protein [Streptomyces phyllanthi]|uniref:ABC transporter family substrate-binding protein n=1 Tax=Streptomyces phyllanthi TaxID=1803180 RepID=A0A5N8W1J6_9ACTN|nr:ABC transporter family substrate-binding protein [Streptomyces phyllanthi]MPY41393.1 ABC transporter family substrate-binding protein [Streptomyces phyllanthi]